MKSLASLIFFSLAWGSMHPAWSQVGTPFTMESFKPFLKRGYNTLLGWRGQPVTLKDPHLYLHAPHTQHLLAAVEFGLQQQRVEYMILKITHAFARLDYAETQELKWFLLLSSNSRVTLQHVQAAFSAQKKCPGTLFRLGQTPELWLTVYSDYQSTYVRIAQTGPAEAPLLANCRA